MVGKVYRSVEIAVLPSKTVRGLWVAAELHAYVVSQGRNGNDALCNLIDQMEGIELIAREARTAGERVARHASWKNGLDAIEDLRRRAKKDGALIIARDYRVLRDSWTEKKLGVWKKVRRGKKP